LVFFGLLLSAAGFSLLYAGLKGDSATIGGVPLWKAPWAPFFAAITGGKGFGSSGSTGAQQPGVSTISASEEAPLFADFVANVRSGMVALRNGVFNALHRAQAKAA
jgi:hypothetical protein